ncbi:hypothetical protein GCM10017788_37630 [Amycolatopsis acidiphila]|nr:hypothetical protein GCM10017788_37630 [Amycolatopsis acidiphila]
MRDGADEIFPDPVSAAVADSWRNGAAKTLEHQNPALPQPAAAGA